MKRTSVALALSLTFAGAPPLAAQEPVRAAAVLRTIAHDGADSAIARYFLRDSAFGDGVLRGIASGDSAWLRVARLLRPAADAGVSESLGIAVADALPAAPARVLALLGPAFPLETVCALPFIEQPATEEAA